MKTSPPSGWNTARLDVLAFAQASADLQKEEKLSRFERLLADAEPGSDLLEPVRWRLQGEIRAGEGGSPTEPWLHLQAEAQVPLLCQRCMTPVLQALDVNRWFRFVADEATAEAQDEDSEEDVLALEPRPNVHDLIEDELLMALPLVPMHDVCPEPVAMQAGDLEGLAGDDEPARPHPFADLARLKK